MKIVVAIDDSPYSQNVLHAIETRRWSDGTQFKIVTVVEPIDLPLDDEEAFRIQEIQHRRKEHAEALCQKARHRIENAVQGSVVFFEIREGHAANEILGSAVDWDADQIIVGAHGHSICPHNLPGSVSTKLARQAPCHVEVIRTPFHQSRELTRAV